MVLSLAAVDTVLGPMNTAEIHVSSCFPYQSVFFGWECQLAENSLQPFDFPWWGVTFITNKIWEPLDVVLPDLLTHPGKTSNSFSFFLWLSASFKSPIFSVQGNEQCKLKGVFSICFFPKRAYTLCAEWGEVEWDGTGWDTNLLLRSFKGNLKTYCQIMCNFLV